MLLSDNCGSETENKMSQSRIGNGDSITAMEFNDMGDHQGEGATGALIGTVTSEENA